MMTTQTTTYTISNIAGGDLRTFRRAADGTVSVASIRHARRIQRTTFGGWTCSDPDAADEIQQALDDQDQ